MEQHNLEGDAMDHDYPLAPPVNTLTFDEFWEWVQGHFNCILRAGTHDMAVFDDDSVHWRFSQFEGDSCLVQVARGKIAVAEFVLHPSRVSYVQVSELGPEEYLYELVYDEDDSREIAYFFVLTHDFDEDESQPRQWMN